MELSFGEKIKTARKSKKLTQKQLADKIGAAHNSVSDWENNKNRPDPDTIELLCGVLEITPNYLLSASSDGFSPVEKMLIKKYRLLDLHGKKTVDYIIEAEIIRTEELREAQKKRIRTYKEALKQAQNARKYSSEPIQTSLVAESRTPYNVAAAHQRTDIEVTDEMIKHDDDIMDDDDF